MVGIFIEYINIMDISYYKLFYDQYLNFTHFNVKDGSLYGISSDVLYFSVLDTYDNVRHIYRNSGYQIDLIYILYDYFVSSLVVLILICLGLGGLYLFF